MRICRFRSNETVQFGFYSEERIVPFTGAFAAYSAAGDSAATGKGGIDLPSHTEKLEFLPPSGSACEDTRRVADWLSDHIERLSPEQLLAVNDVELLVPLPRPNKLFLLAGNYAKHIEEGGGIAEERADTFPYVFMKPPSTTLTDPGEPIRIPSVSPNYIDWELELAVIIGRTARHVSESEALDYVAGYTIINDISDRQFRPNPNRKERPRDKFFDWLHGKWHDSFCPCGPCVTTPDAIPDPQQLDLKLRVSGELKQDASTSQQIFPVAAVIEFISNITTLEPGDIISTGTPQGVGRSSDTYLAAGHKIQASISGIGTLVTMVADEE